MAAELQERIEIRPQPGPQEAFLASPADIVIYGGAAGGGKTFGLLMDPIRFLDVPGYGAVVFRRQYPDITAEGGMWDESFNLYMHVGGRAIENPLEWSFPSGTKVSFRHMQHAKDRFKYKGSQIPAILWDQLEEFEKLQFWYMLSRNRSTCGVKPYMRATVNPPEEEDHWLYEIIGAWVHPEDPDYPYEPGALRWFTREGDDIVWVDEDWRDKDDQPATSITFIPATIYDNPALLSKDPGYLSKLRALPLVDRERLLEANWTIQAEGNFFKREWFKIVDEAPADLEVIARVWDLAATEEQEGGDPDYTVGVLMGLKDGVWYILDILRDRLSDAAVDALMDQTAELDGKRIRIELQQDPGNTGKADVARRKRRLAGYEVHSERPTGDKVARARPMSAAAEAGNVRLVKYWPSRAKAEQAATWIKAFINECVAFPGGKKDQVDAASWGILRLSEAGPPAAAGSPTTSKAATRRPQNIGRGSRGLRASRQRAR